MADSGKDIWVATGTYKPTSDHGLAIGDRGKHFRMMNGVTICGGFSPGGGTFTDRDPNQYETILSGDIGGPGYNDNCYHVFYHPDGLALDATAILDGFTITAGRATDSTWPSQSGGGMHNHSSSPTVISCTFIGNSASYGGGMENYLSSSPTVIGCIFTGNSAYRGGGMRNYENSSSTVIGCTFTGNSASGEGGGMANWEGSSPTVTNCTFSGNYASRYGGGMYNRYDSNSTMTNCVLWGNTAASAGNDIFNYGTSSPVISYCDIGGCFFDGLWDSSLGTDGGGNIDADPLFVDAAGGDLHLQNTSPCVNAGTNSAPSLPATDFEGDPRIIHGIVDIGVDEVVDVLLLLDVTIEPFSRAAALTLDPPGGMYPPGTEVTISANAEDGYIFEQWSGDLSGNDNPTTITMDSHKYVTADFAFTGDIIYVDANAVGSNSGTSWDDAFTDLQDAMASAGEPNQIWVAAGTYYPNSDYGLGIGYWGSHFRMINGVAIYGGFPAGGGTLTNRDPNQHETILSGDLGASIADMNDCYHVFYHPDGLALDATAILDGFIITGGRANGSGDHYSGGGMYNSSNSPTVISCTFVANSARDGGGMYNYSSSSPTVISCTFSGNSDSGMFNRTDSSPTVTGCIFSDNSGNGMVNLDSSSPTVLNCTFTGNSSGSGGGMYNLFSSPTVTGCTFSGNSADVGGGMNNYNSSPTVLSCAFIANSARDGGGMYNNSLSGPTVIGCSFVGNTATYGNTIACNSYEQRKPSTIVLTNCILWDGLNEIWNNDGSAITITYSDVQGGWPGLGNIDVDPLFVDADGADNTVGTEDDNLRLSAGSPCIDAGDPSYVLDPNYPTDLDGQPRIVDGDCDLVATVDMGAYEFNWRFDLTDFAVFASHWAQIGCDAGNGWCGGADMDRLDDVDDKDMRCFAEQWLAGRSP